MEGHRGWAPPHDGPAQHHPQSQQSPPSRPAGLAQQQQQPHGNGNGPFPFHQSSLASLAGVSQASARQPPHPSQRQDGPPAQQQLQHPGFPLPAISQSLGHAEREQRERGARDVEQVHIKEEEDRRHRELERHRLEQAPQHHPQQQPPMLHQPVAVGPPRAHGPNGLLSNPSIAALQPPTMALGAPSGPGNIFSSGPPQQQPPQHPQQQQMQAGLLMPFPPSGPPQQGPPQQSLMNGAGPQPQAQQPILNDALTYLDQVKVQFAEHPDVYNRFLDIMKDFKSGAIDTPGVIGRVSQLFAGNPELIQGFNTFLPPGYRIECGVGGDGDAIRVTTPMGTTVHNMPVPRPLSRQGDGMGTPQPMGQSAQMMFSPSGRAVGPAVPGVHLSPMETARQQEAMHAQEQRGVNQLQNAVSAAASSGGLRAVVGSPRATPVPSDMGQLGGGLGIEKRGPVEFNHAISYVNKIKNRFAAHPDIYKQFLEILQTYQRESKPIQDVYSQVTRLFGGASDLLEDFKQFLPESAAQAKAAERARMQAEGEPSNMRGEVGGVLYGSPVMSRENRDGRDAYMGTPSQAQVSNRMPPVGNFAPTPVSKDNKRKRGERQGTAGSLIENNAAGPSSKPFTGQMAGKRQKQTHNTVNNVAKMEQPPVSPTLIPALPIPLPPTSTSAATIEELGFFDRAKKAIGNKNTMNEFLKLCNLFSQDMIAKEVLVFRAHAFIGSNPELMKYFTDFVGCPVTDGVTLIENKPRINIPTGRVSLSNCRGLGPSYRLLPKRERQKPCSGRDELCNSVLNDEWASHPTWASEDSGFIAHRKNTYEEALHRIEEERHDYDYNIEACSRTIQLLEPIALQLRRMNENEQVGYKLPAGLGGQSETIYKRIIYKTYGREKGHSVVDELHEAPYRVVPVLLNRLKERLESWRLAQREWEKVWREQTQKMFWRSLDHQFAGPGGNGIGKGGGDKKLFSAKGLVGELAVKWEEQRRAALVGDAKATGPVLPVEVADEGCLVDAAWLILEYARTNLDGDRGVGAFVREFVPIFFGIDSEMVREELRKRYGGTPPSEVEEGYSGAEDVGGSSGRGRKSGLKGGLLRAALVGNGRGGKALGRRDREDSNVSASRATTPDGAASNAGDNAAADDNSMAIDPASAAGDDTDKIEPLVQRWFSHPDVGNVTAAAPINIDPHEPQPRHVIRMWANTQLYCFVRVFLKLYTHLLALKNAEVSCALIVKNAGTMKPAIELGIADRLPSYYFAETGEGANYYNQMLHKFAAVARGELDMSTGDVEEILRRFYLKEGYPLYAFEKLVTIIGKYAQGVLTNEGKERGWDIWNLYRKDRARDARDGGYTMGAATEYRKGIERVVREGELFKIDFDERTRIVGFRMAKRGEAGYADDVMGVLNRENEWRKYIASYTSLDDTEGIPHGRLEIPVLPRNMRVAGASATAGGEGKNYPLSPPADGGVVNGEGEASTASQERILGRLLATKSAEGLMVRVSVDEYKLFFEPSTGDGWCEPMSEREGGEEGVLSVEGDAADRTNILNKSFLKEFVGEEDLVVLGGEWKTLVGGAAAGDDVVAGEEVMNGEDGEAGVEKMEVDE